MRGRALALWQLGFQGTTPVGGPLIGWVIEESEARVGMVVGALSCFAAAAGGAILSRHRIVSVPIDRGDASGIDVAGEEPLSPGTK
jgi:hypothetical protein